MIERDKFRINHIRDAILEVEEYIQGFNEDDFISHKLVKNATVRQFEIIGEAANAISDETINKYSSVPWRALTNFRNVLIHQYFGVDFKQVYKVIQEDLPYIKEQIIKILEDME
ncbi:MAG: DUF86 domain-containing protein [Leptospiraceae bacterium]|nr:DUF86 domain-containing protein [Leptospiraceae bacterium]